MNNYGFTINISPKRWISPEYMELLLPDKKFKKRQQYEGQKPEIQRAMTEHVFEVMKQLLPADYGAYTWEETQAGNLHIHGYFKSDLYQDVEELVKKVTDINSCLSSGKKSQCIFFTKTHTRQEAWNIEYMQKDQKRDPNFLMTLDLKY